MPVPDEPGNADACICPACPTHDDCMKDAGETLFCARGRSSCFPQSRGCICGDCPVWAHYGPAGHYFCMEGAAP
ncbi:MAG: DUF2769 domain-containing protein [Coriobacteriia bacterium]|nr:DUF2769 domain-containing protein [Coriobacteriia bacterium]